MKYLFEITTGEVGESYIRAYVWAESQDHAVQLVKQANGGVLSEACMIRYLFAESTLCFATKLSDSGFEMEEK